METYSKTVATHLKGMNEHPFRLVCLTPAAAAAQLMQVLYVNVCYRTGTWTFPPAANTTSAQRFFLTSTVTYVALSQSPWGSQQPTPPLAWPLPADIFYPFVTSRASRAAEMAGNGAGPITMLVLLAAAVSVVAQLLSGSML